MEDDKSQEDQPSTSKKESQRMSPGTDEDDKRDDGQDSRMDSETSASSSVSLNSRVGMTHAKHKMLKPPIQKESKLPERKKKGRPAGRVEKRSVVRRQVPKKTHKRRLKHKADRKKRDLSISTIFTRLSSGSIARSVGCMYCGHRCCRRRFENGRKKAHRTIKKVRRRRKMPKVKCIKTQTAGSECLQAGSRCLMLSPLCVNANATPPDQETEEPTQDYCEVTPEIIYESVRRLTMWKQQVSIIAIFEYIKRCYPVNSDIPQLFEELVEKLRIAAIVGIVTHTATDHWCLNCALQGRKLTKNHVTLFWNTYGDTMRPVTKKLELPPPKKEQDETQTNTTTRNWYL